MSYRLVEIAEEHLGAVLAMKPDASSEYAGIKTPKDFNAFLKLCEKERMDWRPKAGKTSITRYLLIDAKGEICGCASLHFPLSEEVERAGGNLRFEVPPDKRRQGFGQLTLNRMLFEAVRAGLARVLVVCASSNEGAIKSIQANRGQLESETAGLSRFWINFR